MVKGWFSTEGRPGDRTLAQQMRGLDRVAQECKGKSVLDVGCAEGLVALSLAKQGALVHGVEIVSGHITVANRLASRVDWPMYEKGMATFFVNDANVYVPERPYDIVLLLAILHKLKNPGNACRRFARAATSLVVIRIPPGFGHIIVDERSNYEQFDIDFIMADEGFALEVESMGSFGEPVLYYRRLA